jgi:hypothetical protein
MAALRYVASARSKAGHGWEPGDLVHDHVQHRGRSPQSMRPSAGQRRSRSVIGTPVADAHVAADLGGERDTAIILLTLAYQSVLEAQGGGRHPEFALRCAPVCKRDLRAGGLPGESDLHFRCPGCRRSGPVAAIRQAAYADVGLLLPSLRVGSFLNTSLCKHQRNRHMIITESLRARLLTATRCLVARHCSLRFPALYRQSNMKDLLAKVY